MLDAGSRHAPELTGTAGHHRIPATRLIQPNQREHDRSENEHKGLKEIGVNDCGQAAKQNSQRLTIPPTCLPPPTPSP